MADARADRAGPPRHRTRTPLLGICRGLQIVNVALGGTLVQDLGEECGHVNRGVPIPQVLTTHAVNRRPGSRVAELLGEPTVEVRSAHHQAVDVLGAGLVVTPARHDGHIEAVEHRDAPVLAVQWHPEDVAAPAGQLAALLAGSARLRLPSLAASPDRSAECR